MPFNSLITSSDNCRPAAATFSLKCSTDDVPGMSRMLGERCSSQAKATAIEVVSKRAATLDNVLDCSGETHRVENTAHKQFLVQQASR